MMTGDPGGRTVKGLTIVESDAGLNGGNGESSLGEGHSRRRRPPLFNDVNTYG